MCLITPSYICLMIGTVNIEVIRLHLKFYINQFLYIDLAFTDIAI